jgi:mitofilin
MWLQVPEDGALAGEQPDSGVDGALARMQASLAAGRLEEAAAALEQGTAGTAAARMTAAWARDARTRALANQTKELLQAHACSLASSSS